MTVALSTPRARLDYRFRLIKANLGLILGLLLAALIALVAIFPQLFAHQSPLTIHVYAQLQPPSAAHWFGTDVTGRDVYSRVIYGTRTTVGIVAFSLALSMVVGSLFGMLAGFFGRASDMLGSRIVDVILSFPPLPLGVVITGVLGTATRNLVLAISMIYIPVFFRIARSGAIRESHEDYVEAAQSIGLGSWRILLHHVLRNVTPSILVQYVIMFPLALQIQAALSFLGLGVQPPTPDWGSILEQAKDYLLPAPWMSAFPGIAILVSALSMILIGKAIQSRMDH
jgi:peptide/nickel transport system permease protein